MWKAWYRGVTHAVLVKTWPKKQLRRARPRWDNTVRVDFKKWQFVWIGFDWLRQKPEVGHSELGNEFPRSAKYENFWISLITISFWRAPFSGVLSLWRFYVLKLSQVFFCPDSTRGPKYVNLWGFDIFRHATFGRVLWKGHRPVPNISTWEHHNIHNRHPWEREIRTRNPSSKPAASDPYQKPRDH